MLTIGAVAAQTGLTEHTLRYYEKIGLLDPVPRGPGGQRRYREQDLRWLEFLLRLRATGMPLRDMLAYAEQRRVGNTAESLALRRKLLAAHADKVAEEIAVLQSTLQLLQGKIDIYRGWEASLPLSYQLDKE
ncbi:DNA-binding transcriptional regulator, MerR family [Pseudogulbenkiania subflava DSM 22618]|uniref:DNA-binding transcriptional regulator, MerR family n=2 Tax=Pseudogulbenkiania subflava TaxID=451637 RepID=A0A1Y6B9Z5_9NEIS|nr:DNA-binding transcriptional regulator, MerR family [Pseudogulbenkiania subflava DSM 22618]